MTFKIAGQEYPDDMKLSELAKRLEVEQGFRINAKQFNRIIHGGELTAQEVINIC